MQSPTGRLATSAPNLQNIPLPKKPLHYRSDLELETMVMMELITEEEMQRAMRHRDKLRMFPTHYATPRSQVMAALFGDN